MCTNMKWVKSPYINHPVLVPCGHCSACQQEKANFRTRRIKNNVRLGEICLFVTLTYKNQFIPYVKRSDILKLGSEFKDDSKTYFLLPVYRDCRVRRVRVSSDYKMAYKYKFETYKEKDILVSRELYNKGTSFLRDINKRPDNISVVCYSDLQNFFKRLRVNLTRRYGYTRNFSSFQCAEFGPKTHRAHFHLLIFIPAQDESLFRTAICEAWPYASRWRTSKYIEVAKDASSYVSSYVNRGSDFPPFLTDSQICPRHSYSKGFGLANEHFTLPSIADKIRKRDFTYPVLSVTKSGIIERDILIPKYALSRYFPKFKGYSRLSLFQVFECLQNPQRLSKYSKFLDLNKDELHKYKVSLNNSYRRFLSDLNLSDNAKSRHKYAVMFTDSWQARTNQLYRFWYENKDNVPLLLQYDNWYEPFVHDMSLYNLNFVLHQLDVNPQLIDYDDPNSFPRRVSVTSEYSNLFNQKSKSRKVANICMSSLGFDV